MNWFETEIGGADPRFPSTAAAFGCDPRQPGGPPFDVQRLVSLYWKPVYCLIRRSWSKTNEDAKDLTQEFFMQHVLEGSLLQKFDPARGSFRAYLRVTLSSFLTHAHRVASAQKRGGDIRILPLEDADVNLSDVVPDAETLTPDQVFDAAWKQAILDRAIQNLEQRLKEEQKGIYFEVFKRYDLGPQDASVSYENVGKSLGLGTDAVKNYLTVARQEFRKSVTDALCDYVRTPEALSQELSELFGS